MLDCDAHKLWLDRLVIQQGRAQKNKSMFPVFLRAVLVKMKSHCADFDTQCLSHLKKMLDSVWDGVTGKGGLVLYFIQVMHWKNITYSVIARFECGVGVLYL